MQEALPDDHSFSFLIHDRDSIFSLELDQAVAAIGVRVLRTPPRAPKAVCERVVGTIRREYLDFLIPLSQPHLEQTLNRWVLRYNQGRVHMSLGPGIPAPLNPSPSTPSIDIGFRRAALTWVVLLTEGLLGPTCGAKKLSLEPSLSQDSYGLIAVVLLCSDIYGSWSLIPQRSGVPAAIMARTLSVTVPVPQPVAAAEPVVAAQPAAAAEPVVQPETFRSVVVGFIVSVKASQKVINDEVSHFAA